MINSTAPVQALWATWHYFSRSAINSLSSSLLDHTSKQHPKRSHCAESLIGVDFFSQIMGVAQVVKKPL